MAIPASVEFDTQTEYGLRLPDGREIWPPDQFYGHTFQTREERTALLVVFGQALKRLGLPSSRLGDFKWVLRQHSTATIRYLDHRTEVLDIDNTELVNESALDEEIVDLDAEAPFNVGTQDQ